MPIGSTRIFFASSTNLSGVLIKLIRYCDSGYHIVVIVINGSRYKPLYGPKWLMGLVLNSGFLSMKRLGVLLLPPGWDAHLLVAICSLGDNDPGQGSNPDHPIWSRAH